MLLDKEQNVPKVGFIKEGKQSKHILLPFRYQVHNILEVPGKVDKVPCWNSGELKGMWGLTSLPQIMTGIGRCIQAVLEANGGTESSVAGACMRESLPVVRLPAIKTILMQRAPGQKLHPSTNLMTIQSG